MYPFLFKTRIKATYRGKEFKKINRLPKKERAEQRIATKVFNYWKGTSPLYVNELFFPSKNTYNTRSHMALEIPLKKKWLRSKEHFIYWAVYLEHIEQ